MRSRYQGRAVELLRTALDLMSAEEQRVYWRANVMKDKALDPIRVRLRGLDVRWGGPDR